MNRLDQVLASLPETIDWPEPSPHLSSRVAARTETPVRWSMPRRWVWAAVTATILAIALVPGSRRAVADLIVEAGIRIGVITETPTAGAELDLGEEGSVNQASLVVDFPIAVPGELGDPTAVYLADGVVSMVWTGTGTLPAASGTDVAVLLRQTDVGETRAVKGVGPDTDLITVVVDSAPAVWIEGAEHTFTLLDQDGQPIEETTRLAANVLLWSAEGVDYRLELTGGLETALSIATSLEVR